MSKLVEEAAEYLNETKLGDRQFELDSLIDKAVLFSDPDYEGDEDSVEAFDNIIKTIRKKFGDKIANEVDGVMDKSHWPRHPFPKRGGGSDRLAGKTGRFLPGGGPTKLRKDGKINKAQLKARKKRIKDNLRDKGLTPNLP